MLPRSGGLYFWRYDDDLTTATAPGHTPRHSFSFFVRAFLYLLCWLRLVVGMPSERLLTALAGCWLWRTLPAH
jgi:hypothetical protein